MIVNHQALAKLTAAIFQAAGCEHDEAARVAHHLVEANLVGHDSHGVIRVPTYIGWLRSGKVTAGTSIRVVTDSDVLAVVDGQFGLGQTLGYQAVQLGIDKCKQHGVSVIGLRNAGHLGRIGDWAIMAADAKLISLHFVNTSGSGNLVAPFGGIDRRISANPIAAGVPIAGRQPIVLDMSCCTVAEGKIRVALNRGAQLPDGSIIDAEGRPTNDPKVFYGDPPGSILCIAGHKGYGLAILVEMLAGAITGGSCTNTQNAGRLANGMLSIYLDPERFSEGDYFSTEAARYVDWVKTARTITPDGEILMPGDIEERTKANRLKHGIELDENTWSEIRDTCEPLNLDADALIAG